MADDEQRVEAGDGDSEQIENTGDTNPRSSLETFVTDHYQRQKVCFRLFYWSPSVVFYLEV